MARESLTVLVSGLSSLPASCRRPALFEAAVKKAFTLEKSRAAGEVSVIVLTRAKMRAMNREFLGHDHDTDVISFKHDPVAGIPAAERSFGDIYISGWLAARQARELGHGVLDEALTLAVHGALHLLGHDDHEPRAKARMFRVQDRVLAESKA